MPAQRVGIGASGGKVGGSGGDFLLQKPQTDVPMNLGNENEWSELDPAKFWTFLRFHTLMIST